MIRVFNIRRIIIFFNQQKYKYLQNGIINWIGLQDIDSDRQNSINENSIKLLRGEAVVTTAQNVLMFEPVSESKQGTSGMLSVTNFKLTFITADDNADVRSLNCFIWANIQFVVDYFY